MPHSQIKCRSEVEHLQNFRRIRRRLLRSAVAAKTVTHPVWRRRVPSTDSRAFLRGSPTGLWLGNFRSSRETARAQKGRLFLRYFTAKKPVAVREPPEPLNDPEVLTCSMGIIRAGTTA